MPEILKYVYMEIVTMEKKAFDEMTACLGAFMEKVDASDTRATGKRAGQVAHGGTSLRAVEDKSAYLAEIA